jgi:transcriptional regulator GlxA family with amidase domain
MEERVRNAQVLLETTDGTVAEIAAIVGYEDPLYFSRVFRKARGLSPMKYRRAYREGF